MGTECDIIPLLPGEDPYDAMSRTYDMDVSPDQDRGVAAAAPPGSFPDWQETVTRRVAPLWDWEHAYDAELDYHRFMVPTFGWIIYVERDGVTLILQRSWHLQDGPAPSEADFLALFRDLDCILVYPNAEGWVRLNGGDPQTEIWPE